MRFADNIRDSAAALDEYTPKLLAHADALNQTAAAQLALGQATADSLDLVTPKVATLGDTAASAVDQAATGGAGAAPGAPGSAGPAGGGLGAQPPGAPGPLAGPGQAGYQWDSFTGKYVYLPYGSAPLTNYGAGAPEIGGGGAAGGGVAASPGGGAGAAPGAPGSAGPAGGGLGAQPPGAPGPLAGPGQAGYQWDSFTGKYVYLPYGSAPLTNYGAGAPEIGGGGAAGGGVAASPGGGAGAAPGAPGSAGPAGGGLGAQPPGAPGPLAGPGQAGYQWDSFTGKYVYLPYGSAPLTNYGAGAPEIGGGGAAGGGVAASPGGAGAAPGAPGSAGPAGGGLGAQPPGAPGPLAGPGQAGYQWDSFTGKYVYLPYGSAPLTNYGAGAPEIGGGGAAGGGVAASPGGSASAAPTAGKKSASGPTPGERAIVGAIQAMHQTTKDLLATAKSGPAVSWDTQARAMGIAK